jgi:acyl-coenzyme A thioesterase PaaI-like protein
MTDPDSRTPLPHFSDHRCFACGTANPTGLKLTFFRRGRGVEADVCLGPDHVGWEGIAHGGILSTVLDEIMSWTIIAFSRRFFVTRTLTVSFRHPGPIGVPLLARGELDGEPSEAGGRVRGAITAPDGTVIATATAEMRFLPAERVLSLPVALRADLDRIFHELATG